MSVREPAANGYRMLRMKYIRRGGIINYNRFSKITADLRKVLQKSVQNTRLIASQQTNFDIISLVIVTAISKESMVDDMMDVQLI